MEFDTETWGGAIIWLVMLTLLGFAFYRAKTRRRHIGSGAAGAVYGMMNEDKRKAVEIVVADKAAAHDFEHADDDDGDDPPSLKLRRAGRTENERAR